ncbi:MAG: hypothetical protein ACFFDN_10095 [Candidatus Hodarchaeota archaeon]
MESRKKVYISLFSIFLFFYISSIIYFSLIPQDPSPEGQFIIPGDERFEQLFSALMIPISALVSGIISIFLFTRLYLKKYVKSLSKFQKVGIVRIEKLEGYLLWRKLMIRAALSALFIINITLTLATQEIIIQFLRSVNPDRPYMIPDPLTMLMLYWIIAIPCTFILVPIWLIRDSGVVVTKKIKGVDFDSADLAIGSIHRVIKGFIKISFFYNFFVVTISFAISTYTKREPGYEFDVVGQLISPIIMISYLIPLIILIDYQKDRFRIKLEQIFVEFDMFKELICEYNLRSFDS